MSLGSFSLADEPLGGFGGADLPAVDLSVADISFGLQINSLLLTQTHNLLVDDISFRLMLNDLDLSFEPRIIGPGTLTIGITGPSISIGISP